MVLFLWGVLLAYAIPLESEQISSVGDQNYLAMEIMAADNAFDIGLLTIAESMYSRIYMHQKLNDELRLDIGLKLVATLINEEKYNEALEVLGSLGGQQNPRFQLLMGIVQYSLKSAQEAKKWIAHIKKEQLKGEDLYWFYLLQGIMAQDQGQMKDARKFFDKTAEVNLTEPQKMQVDILKFRAAIFNGEANEALAQKLAKKVQKNKEKPEFTILIKEYALVLDEIGKKKEAIDALSSAITSLPIEQIKEMDSIYLLLGLIAGAESDQGQAAFRQVLLRSQDIIAAKSALYLLIRGNSEKNRGYLLSLLTEIIDKNEAHPIVDSILIERAQVYLENGKLSLAEKDATTLVTLYPGSTHKKAALSILAYLAWKQEPARYRIAADYLSQLLKITADPAERAQLSVMTGDCYFLNEDFNQAAEVYNSVIKEEELSNLRGQVLFQLVLSYLHLHDIKAATEVLDEYSLKPGVTPMYTWRTEWSLISAIKDNNDIQGAFVRIRKLLGELKDASIVPELSLRLMWLKAQLSLESGKSKKVPQLVDSIIALLKQYAPEELDSNQLKLIASHALLLKGQALLLLGQEKAGMDSLQLIRDQYSESNPAILSYIVEARYFASTNNIAKAQQQMIKLSDDYPNSEYAPIALYEAALNLEARGLSNSYQEALTILERISSGYPSSSLVFAARIKQADILRKMNNFGAAQLVCEELIKKYSDHPQRYFAEFARADCLFAQAGNNTLLLGDAAMNFERLMDLPNLPIDARIEAGYKAGTSLEQGMEERRAQEVFWTVISQFLKNEKIRKNLNKQGKYWLSRTIIDLGGILERNNNIKQANNIYQLISEYQLPGEALAKIKN